MLAQVQVQDQVDPVAVATTLEFSEPEHRGKATTVVLALTTFAAQVQKVGAVEVAVALVAREKMLTTETTTAQVTVASDLLVPSSHHQLQHR